MTCKPRKQLVIVFNYVRLWSDYKDKVWLVRKQLGNKNLSSVERPHAEIEGDPWMLYCVKCCERSSSLIAIWSASWQLSIGYTHSYVYSYKSTITHCKLKHFPLVACFTQLQAWFKVKKILTLPPSVEDNLFVNKPEGHLLQGWRLSLWVATSPKLWAAFCPFHLCTCQ